MEKRLLDEIKILSYRFKDYLVIERKLSGNTVYSYYKDIIQFNEYLKDSDISTLDDMFSLECLDSFLIWLYGKGIKARSITRKLSSISLFVKFLRIEDIITENKSYLLNRPKIGKKLPNYFSIEEIERFLKVFDQNKPEGIRDKTLFELIYSCGLRVSEVSNLKISSIYFNESVLKVFGKGGKDRYVPIGERAVLELKNYLINSRNYFEKKQKNDYLFLNYRGERLTRKGIWKNLKHACILAGLIDKNFTVHSLRHSFATHLLQNGADLRSVQKLLGHKNIITTEIYTHLDVSHLRDAYDKFHIHS
ncbi:MAG: tyrosine recombinase [Spirochaetes bacterium]|nr:tyrosine recombinase [Spirochaetota bacterium]